MTILVFLLHSYNGSKYPRCAHGDEEIKCRRYLDLDIVLKITSSFHKAPHRALLHKPAQDCIITASNKHGPGCMLRGGWELRAAASRATFPVITRDQPYFYKLRLYLSTSTFYTYTIPCAIVIFK